MAAPSGTNVTLEHGDYRATVVEVGAGLRTLTRAGLDLVAGYPEGEICSGGRGQLLLPWPNRIDGGRYRFEGRDHQLPLSEPARANAIHGLTRWVGWRLLDSSSSSATWGYRLHPQPGYPGDLELTVDYLLADTGLRVAVSALNLGSGPAPYGAGAHPYLTVGRQLDECELLLPAAIRTSSDARGLPGPAEPVDRHDVDFRSARRIGAAVLDDAFGVLTYEGDVGDGGVATARLRDPETGRSATLWADRAFRWLQVFSGDTLPSGARESLAVEPMTCPPNAFVSTVDLVVLQPGESHRAVFGIS